MHLSSEDELAISCPLRMMLLWPLHSIKGQKIGRNLVLLKKVEERRGERRKELEIPPFILVHKYS
jgi:hypothetical protein